VAPLWVELRALRQRRPAPGNCGSTPQPI
jgi:hypothetical protein